MEKTLTKAKLGQMVQQGLALDPLSALAFVDEMFEAIRTTLEIGEPVKIVKAMNFEVRRKSARPGRNPKTSTPILIKARTVVSCKAGPKLKALLRARSLTISSPESSVV